MHIWLIQVGEPLPTDPCGPRLYRSGIMANLFHQRGHTVEWFASDFNHLTKTHRGLAGKSRLIVDGYEIVYLQSPGYSANVSLRRLWDHAVLGRSFRVAKRKAKPPDVILCSYPTIELAVEAVAHGQRHGVPVVLDVRDLWPEVFLDSLPKPAQALARRLLYPYYRKARYALGQADVLIGNTDAMVEWARKLGRTLPKARDHGVPMGYPERSVSTSQLAAAERFWDSLGICQDRWDLICCFLGNLGRQFDLETVVRASEIAGNSRVAYVICGTGERLEELRQRTRRMPCFFFPGWVEAPKITALLMRSHVGLAPYVNSLNFRLSIPNKPLEYLSAGVPILGCLDGALRKMIEADGCGAYYESGNAGALARQLEAWCREPGKLRAMSSRAKALFEARYRADVVYGRFCDFLETLA